jgi:HD-GYP domain-containing protein (c-di-GMP phosphodiesterase class II)
MGDTARVFRYLQQNLETVLADEALDRIEKSSLVRDTTQMWTVNFFNNEEARTALGVKQSQQFLDMLFDSAAGDRRNLMSLMKGDGQKNLRLYNHCLNVALLGLAFTGYLGWSQGKSRGFAQGALVHDVGLTRIPPDILEKQGRLTQAEMLEIQCHPTESFRIVKGFVSLPYEAVQMVLQHHENVDGSGYPKGLKTPTIHSWALILRIIDSYEAMTAPRPWRAPMQPHEALVIMRREWEHNRHFDQNYLKAFIRFLAGN